MAIGEPLIGLSGAFPLLHRTSLFSRVEVLTPYFEALVVVGPQLFLVVLPLLVVTAWAAHADLNASAVSARLEIGRRDFQAESVVIDNAADIPLPVLVGSSVTHPLLDLAPVAPRLKVGLIQVQAAAIVENDRAFVRSFWPQCIEQRTGN